jgi:hypothetical protein
VDADTVRWVVEVVPRPDGEVERVDVGRMGAVQKDGRQSRKVVE